VTPGDPIGAHLASLRARGIADSTVRARRYRLLALARRGPLLDQDPAGLRAWRDEMAATVQACTVRTAVQHICGFYRWAYAAGLVERDHGEGLGDALRRTPVPHRRGPDPAALRRYTDHLRLRNFSERTIMHRRYCLRALDRRAPLLEHTAETLGEWELVTLASCGPSARRNAVYHARGFYQWAVSVSLLQADPSAALSVPRSPRRLPRPMPEADLHTAIVNAPPRIRPWLMLAALGGLRCCEIACLRREDVLNSQAPPALLVHGKGDKERVVPLPAQLLHEPTPLPRAGWLFARLDGRSGPVSAAIVSEQCNRYLHSMAITHNMHSIRHRAATAWYAESRDLRLVQELLGHASPETTAGYAALVPGEAADVVGRVAARPFGLAARRLA